jgi:predicted enzyme related to lactoylglutathione lyase
VAENAHIGLVDGKRGALKPSENKPVMITVIVDDIDAWHRHLVENGVKIDQPPKEPQYLRMKTLLFRDPEDYVVEILKFLEKPYGQG